MSYAEYIPVPYTLEWWRFWARWEEVPNEDRYSDCAGCGQPWSAHVVKGGLGR